MIFCSPFVCEVYVGQIKFISESFPSWFNIQFTFHSKWLNNWSVFDFTDTHKQESISNKTRRERSQRGAICHRIMMYRPDSSLFEGESRENQEQSREVNQIVIVIQTNHRFNWHCRLILVDSIISAPCNHYLPSHMVWTYDKRKDCHRKHHWNYHMKYGWEVGWRQR